MKDLDTSDARCFWEAKSMLFSVNYVGFSCVKTFDINVPVKFFLFRIPSLTIV